MLSTRHCHRSGRVPGSTSSLPPFMGRLGRPPLARAATVGLGLWGGAGATLAGELAGAVLMRDPSAKGDDLPHPWRRSWALRPAPSAPIFSSVWHPSRPTV